MKPSVHPPSPGSEQSLLQAARDMDQPAPAPALDAAILDAAARRAAQIRAARAATASPSAWQRLSRWLFGDGERRGHFRQAVAASLVAGVALGLALQVGRETAPASPEAVITKPPPPAAPAATAQEDASARAAPPVAKKRAEASADRLRQHAVPSPPPQAEARQAAEPLPAAAPAPAPARMESQAAPPAGALPSPAQDAAKMRETEIDAQLGRVLELRRAGKDEEAERLLRQLRQRHPDGDIDERLRQREKDSR